MEKICDRFQKSKVAVYKWIKKYKEGKPLDSTAVS